MRHNALVHANSSHITNDKIKSNGSTDRSHNKYNDYKIKFDLLV